MSPVPLIGDQTLRARLAVAGALALLALGLPWTTAYSVPGYVTPGFCTTTYDAQGYGSVYCSPGFVNPGYTNPAAPGFSLDVRVYLALLLTVGFWGLRQRSPVLITIALTAGATALVANPGAQAGQLVWLAALALADHALADAGLLPERSRLFITRPSRPLRQLLGWRPAGPRPAGAPAGSRP